MISKRIGSHNSLSYIKPQWWFRILNWTTRCQSLNIKEQYKKGVRLFDIRLKWSKERQDWVSGHGIATYDIDVWEIISYLNYAGGCTIRIILEKGDEDRFISDVKDMLALFLDVEFICGRKKKGWVKLLPELPEPELNHFYWTHDRWWKIPFPRVYAKRHNAENFEKVNDERWSLFDFV